MIAWLGHASPQRPQRMQRDRNSSFSKAPGGRITPVSAAAGAESRRSWDAGIAIRLYAEDPVLQLPQPGFIREMTGPARWQRDFAEAVFD